MRISFQNLTRPKDAGNVLKSLLGPSCSLSEAREGIAKACGYRDWHDLQQVTKASDTVTRTPATEDAFLSVASRLRVAHPSLQVSEVIDVITRHDLLGKNTNSIECSINVVAALYSQGEMKAPSKLGVGSIVEFPDQTAIVCRVQDGWNQKSKFDPVMTLCSHIGGPVLRLKSEISFKENTPLFIPHRLWVPYGMYKEQDGSSVIFSRDYMPMWRIRDGFAPTACKPWTYIEHDETVYFDEGRKYGMGSKQKHEWAIKLLSQFRVKGLPYLVNAMPFLIEMKGDISDAVKKMAGPEAELNPRL